MIFGLQIVALLFAFSMIYFALLHYRRKEINRFEMVSWASVWVFVSLIVIFPEFLRKFAVGFFVTRAFDLMVFGGFILVISMVASSYLRTKRLEKKMEDLVRREALKNKK